MRAFSALLALGLLSLPAADAAEPARRPIVMELFTSQGCSSCPPADALLRELAATRDDVLALAFHVTYWDRLGWPDPFALPAATARQQGYVGISQAGTIYTPQLVVEGRQDIIGSDRAAVLAALSAARPLAATELALRDSPDGVTVTLGSGSGAGQVLVFGYDPEHRTQVARGENAGRALVEANIVRGIDVAGTWNGAPLQLTRPRPPGQNLAAIVQAADGTVLAATRAQAAVR